MKKLYTLAKILSNRSRCGIFLILLGLAWPAGADVRIFSSSLTQTHLLELFSSEGCSSCPPADRWITELNTSPHLWKSVVPMVFHVDYWDNLGWPDRFAAKEFTQRQRAYAKKWGSDSVYTPAFVLNGKEWKNWSGGKQVLNSPGPLVGVLKVKQADDEDFTIEFKLTDPGLEPALAFVAFLGSGLSTNVYRGENHGKTLRHYFVVFDMKSEKLRERRGLYIARIRMNKAQLRDAAQHSVAVWIVDKDGTPLQATGAGF